VAVPGFDLSGWGGGAGLFQGGVCVWVNKNH